MAPTTRLFLSALAAALLAPGALAQQAPGDRPGVRIGLGVGPSIYVGPDILAGDVGFQDDIVATSLGVTAEVSGPLAGDVLRWRLGGGMLNLLGNRDRADVGTYAAVPGTTRFAFTPDRRINPFVTGPVLLASADLMAYLTPAGRGISPYVFSGVSGLFATGEAAPGLRRQALAIPVGLGVEIAAGRNLSLFAEGSYRFGVTRVGAEPVVVPRTAGLSGGTDCNDPRNSELPECKPCVVNPNLPECQADPCLTNPGAPQCRGEVRDETRTRFAQRVNQGLVLGGLRLGFGSAPVPVIPPPPPPPVVIVPPPPVQRPICDLVELNPVYFDFGTATLSPRSRALLAENVELLMNNPECCVFVDGFVDNTEADRFGMPLGGRRAQAVYDYYLNRGVPASKMQVRNRGASSPNCDKEDPGIGCERNRRVESIPMDCERFMRMMN